MQKIQFNLDKNELSGFHVRFPVEFDLIDFSERRGTLERVEHQDNDRIRNPIPKLIREGHKPMQKGPGAKMSSKNELV